MTARKEYSPKDLAEEFRRLKTLRARVAKAELSSSRKAPKEADAATKQRTRESSTKQQG